MRNIRGKITRTFPYPRKSVIFLLSLPQTLCSPYTRKTVLSCQFSCVFSPSKTQISPSFLKLVKKYRSIITGRTRQWSLSANSNKCLVHALDASRDNRLRESGSFLLYIEKDFLRFISRFIESLFICKVIITNE